VAAAAGKYARFELERRYLLDHVPDGVDRTTARLITDRYIVGTRLRLRRIEPLDGGESTYKFGQKEAPSPPDFSRTTITNIYLTANEYHVLAEVAANELRKCRYTLVHDGHQYSIDAFEGDLAGLVLAEVSFEAERELDAHPTPSFATRDVSQDVRFTGAELAMARSFPTG
jgi:CYTH domain-containing protein